MNGIKSHPDIILREHIRQVRLAALNILQKHSEKTQSIINQCDLLDIINFHDIGKVNPAFQEYIEDPLSYSGDQSLKSHSPLSALLYLLYGMEKQSNRVELLSNAAVIYGHHRGFPELENLRGIGSGKLAKTLKQQIETGLPEDIIQELLATNIEFKDKPWAKTQRFLDMNLIPAFQNMPIDQGVKFRLRAQFMLSLLLEADKVFLAVSDPEHYLTRKRRRWESIWIDKLIGSSVEDKPINPVRRNIRDDIFSSRIKPNDEEKILSLTAPTGSGKTLLAATWLLEQLEKPDYQYKKAIIVLPFLSIIDQTAKIYSDLLRRGKKNKNGAWLLQSHSLAERHYNTKMENEDEWFFIDTWQTEIVITTYDQFLMALFDPRSKYQMRFHNLFDSLIVIDEVQSIPCKLWKPLSEVLSTLSSMSITKILMMSATLPRIIPKAQPLLRGYQKYFKMLSRYKLVFLIKNRTKIDDFISIVKNRRDTWLSEGEKVLITLNTRKSARRVRDAIAENWPVEHKKNQTLYFISSDVTPVDRLKAIEDIGNKHPCIVVSTQCVEAGVDLDMDFVMRDFAPLDSIVQIAGRCNRNGEKKQGIVEVYDLVDDNSKRYADMIYDDVHLNVTRQLIHSEIEEQNILEYTAKYFQLLSERKNLGEKILEDYVEWENTVSIRELLRGPQKKENTYIVIKKDPDLRKEMEKANQVEDKWKRREAWRALSPRISRISVNTVAKDSFRPESIAEEFLGQWLLRDNFYSSEKGLLLPTDIEARMF